MTVSPTQGTDAIVSEEPIARDIDQRTLAAWRSRLVQLRGKERRRSMDLSPETGRLLEVVGQVLAQGSGPLPPEDVKRLVELTEVEPTYRDAD